MSTVLMLVPGGGEEDEVAQRSGWIAALNREALTSRGVDVRWMVGFRGTPPVEADDAGVAYFGHGDPHGIFDGEGQPIFGGEAAAALDGRWVHAFACMTADKLGPRLVEAGAQRFVGYAAWLRASWDQAVFPPELESLARAALAAVNVALADGAGPDQIRQQLWSAVDDVAVWFASEDRDPDLGYFLTFCQQLIGKLTILPSPA